MSDTKPTTKASPKREGRPTRAPTLVFVDYVGTPAPDGDRPRADRISALVAGSDDEDKTPPRLVIRAGLNIPDLELWRAHCPEAPKTDSGPPQKRTPFQELVADGHVLVLEGLPTDTAGLLELAARTSCPAALAALVDHERGRKGGNKTVGDKTTPSRSRAAVMQALAARLKVVGRRAKAPNTPSA